MKEFVTRLTFPSRHNWSCNIRAKVLWTLSFLRFSILHLVSSILKFGALGHACRCDGKVWPCFLVWWPEFSDCKWTECGGQPATGLAFWKRICLWEHPQMWSAEECDERRPSIFWIPRRQYKVWTNIQICSGLQPVWQCQAASSIIHSNARQFRILRACSWQNDYCSNTFWQNFLQLCRIEFCIEVNRRVTLSAPATTLLPQCRRLIIVQYTGCTKQELGQGGTSMYYVYMSCSETHKEWKDWYGIQVYIQPHNFLQHTVGSRPV